MRHLLMIFLLCVIPLHIQDWGLLVIDIKVHVIVYECRLTTIRKIRVQKDMFLEIKEGRIGTNILFCKIHRIHSFRIEWRCGCKYIDIVHLCRIHRNKILLIRRRKEKHTWSWVYFCLWEYESSEVVLSSIGSDKR